MFQKRGSAHGQVRGAGAGSRVGATSRAARSAASLRSQLPATTRYPPCVCPDAPSSPPRHGGRRLPAATATAPPLPGRGGPPHGLRTGFERLAADGYAQLGGQKIGIVTNPTGVTRDVRHIVDVMHADDRVDLVAVFGPEHGFRGTAQAGGSEGRHDDPATGLPVYDTYLKSGHPLADVFTASGVDTVVFDIQDVGARFYTYIWTLYDCMEAARLAGKRFLVLDRPNPVTGRAAQGPVLHQEFATFVGREPIAQAHGMTVAELARLFNAEFLATPVELETVLMSGWRRSRFYDDSGPALGAAEPEHADAGHGARVRGDLSVRGDEPVGGPGHDAAVRTAGRGGRRPAVGGGRERTRAARCALQGGVLRADVLQVPGEDDRGVQIHVHDRAAVDPVRTGIALLVTARKVWSGFAWRPDHWIDKLTGSTWVRTMIDAGAGTDEVVAGWQEELAAFRRVRREYLLYR